jgi:hypothetical protein
MKLIIKENVLLWLFLSFLLTHGSKVKKNYSNNNNKNAVELESQVLNDYYYQTNDIVNPLENNLEGFESNFSQTIIPQLLQDKKSNISKTTTSSTTFLSKNEIRPVKPEQVPKGYITPTIKGDHVKPKDILSKVQIIQEVPLQINSINKYTYLKNFDKNENPIEKQINAIELLLSDKELKKTENKKQSKFNYKIFSSERNK